MAIAPARPASTVVLVRPSEPGSSDPGWETYLVRRSAQSPVLADLWVFPGGTLRADDHEPNAHALSHGFSPADAHAALSRTPGHPPSTADESFGYFIAAARELFEEAGVLLCEAARDELEARDEATRLDLAERRLAVERGAPFADLVAGLGLRLVLDRLVYYAHWITPEALPQRFDARFFLTQLLDGEEASPSPFELAEGAWMSADRALERAKNGELPLHFATFNHLRRLAPHRTMHDLLDFARTKAVVPVMPATREQGGRLVPFLPPELGEEW